MTAAKERILSQPEGPSGDLPLAAGVPVAENSRQGFESKGINSQQGWSEVNFKTAPGMQVSLRRNGIRSRCQSLNRYAYALNNPTTFTDPLGLEEGVPSSCDDLAYATSHAECPTTPVCEYFMLNCGDGGYGGGGGGGGGGGEGGGGAPGSNQPWPGNADTSATEGLLSSKDCVVPSPLTRMAILAGMYAAKLLSTAGLAQTMSVSWGVGGSIAATLNRTVGLGPSASVSWSDTVDIYGNAAQTSVYKVTPLSPAGGIGAIAGLQVGTSKSTVPTTPQASSVWASDPSISLGGALGGRGLNVSWGNSGTTVTYGTGIGAKAALSGKIFPAYVIAGSIPYCR